MNPREEEFDGASSRLLSPLKNPRIVRVSRALKGKDRHSKVCTIRGLRDRRIRLSVQTAIQVYDLQHRLGLSQPSKVVDWLIQASKDDINKLPPLPIIPPQNEGFPLPYNTNPSFFQCCPSNLSPSHFGEEGDYSFASFSSSISSLCPCTTSIDPQAMENPLFPTTLQFITHSHEDETLKQDIKY